MLRKAQAPRLDEFALILLAGFILLTIFMIGFMPPTAKFEVTPNSVDLEIQRGSSSVITLTINGTLFNMTLAGTGEIKNWLSFSKNNFDIVEETTVDVNVKIPSNAQIKTYRGGVTLTSGATTKTIPVTISVTNITTVLVSRPIILGDFTINFPGGKETLDSKENVEVTKGISRDTKINLISVLTDEKLSEIAGGEIQLTITDTNKLGNLIITFNGEKIYDKKTDAGLVSIPLDKSLIKNTNIVSIEAGSPGIVFWSNTVYKLRTASFVIDSKVVSSKIFTFNLDTDEVKNFKEFRLTFRMKDYSKPMPDLIVKINNQIVSFEKPPLGFFNKVLTEDILGNKLLVARENNTISFSIEKDGFMKIADATLVVSH